jgi:hypothetical protein
VVSVYPAPVSGAPVSRVQVPSVLSARSTTYPARSASVLSAQVRTTPWAVPRAVSVRGAAGAVVSLGVAEAGDDGAAALPALSTATTVYA